LPEDRKKYYPRFSDQEYRRRYRKIREYMDRFNIDCLVIYGDAGKRDHNQANGRYVSNYADYEAYSYVVFPRDGDPTVFEYLSTHLQRVRNISVIGDVRWAGLNVGKSIADQIVELGLEKANIGIVGVGSEPFKTQSLPADHYDTLKKELPKAHFTNATSWFEEIRIIKSAEEIEFLRKGAELTDLAMDCLVKAVRPGKKEYELVADTWCEPLRKGGSLCFQLLESVPMSDVRMWMPGPCLSSPSNRTIKRGDLIITEISVSYDGYCGQLIRPIALGKPTKELQDLFNVSVEVYEGIRKVLRPGKTENDVLKAAKPFVDAGLKWQILLHGWDQNLMPPVIGAIAPSVEGGRPPFEFKENMVVVNEPNPYNERDTGMFIGEVNVVTKRGGQSLHKYPLEFITIPC